MSAQIDTPKYTYLKRGVYYFVVTIFTGFVWNANSSACSFNCPKQDEVIEYKGWDIPQYVKPDPNLATLRHYFQKNFKLLLDPQIGRYQIDPTGNHEVFEIAEVPSKTLSEEMAESSILSYIYFDNGQLIYDEKSPPQRLGDIYRDETPYISNSVGKSIVSYITGHAICDGYISDIDTTIDDWPLVDRTLYKDQRLIDLLNMNAGDLEYVDDSSGLIGTGRWYNTHSIETFARRELKDSKPIPLRERKHHYNGLVTNIILNYVIHKTGNQFNDLLQSVFQEKVKIQHPVYLQRNLYARNDQGQMTNEVMPIESGTATYGVYATRYDYLRIAKAMLDDWKSETCVGRYLKRLADNKIPQKPFYETDRGDRFSHKSYAGQFHMDYMGLEQRNIFGMEGYGGQTLMIDFDEERIVSVITVHTDFDYKRLVLDLLVKGHLE